MKLYKFIFPKLGALKLTPAVIAITSLSITMDNDLLANPQNSPTDFYANITYKDIPGSDIITPDVTIGWTRPTIAPDSDGDTSGSDSPENVGGSHDLTLYSLTVQDVNGRLPSRDLPISAQELEQDISSILLSGVFYDLNLYAKHIHTIINEETGDKIDIPVESDPANLKIITTLDTTAIGTDNGLELTFEYIPGVNYRIALTPGAAYSIADFEDVQELIITENDLTANNIFVHPNNGRQYVKYLLSNGVQPGQMYSAYVIPAFPEGTYLAEETTISEDPEIVTAMTNIPLRVFNIGNGKIRLEWSIAPNLQENSYKLSETKIYAQGSGQNGNIIFTYPGDYGAQIGYYELFEPVISTNYRIDFTFTNPFNHSITLSTQEVNYNPYQVSEKPAAPQIPAPFNPDLDLSPDSVREFLVKGDSTPYNSPYLANQTFSIVPDFPLRIQLVWDAYFQPDNPTVLDFDVVYDIWIVERKESLDNSLTVNGLAPNYSNFSISPSDNNNFVSTPFGDVVGFKTTLNEYYNTSEDVYPLTTNKTYYIQIVAKKQIGTQFNISEPTIVAITIDKNGDIFVPPVMGKPPLAIIPETLSTTAVDIIWRENWIELLYNGAADSSDFYSAFPDNIELAKQWNSKIFVSDADPKVFFKDPSSIPSFEINLLTQDHLNSAMDYVGSNFFLNNFVYRNSTLGSNVRYEIKTMPYEALKNMLGSTPLENWIYDIEQNGGSPDWNAGWSEPAIYYYVDDSGLGWNRYPVEDLQPNTAYITFLRAFRVLDDGTKLTQSYSSFIIYNTLSSFGEEEEIPIVPNLNLSDVTDSSIEVFFKFNHNFDYELVYSRFDDPDQATNYPLTDISSDPSSPFFVGDGENAYVEILGLFPDTEYHVWLRAKQKEGDIVSAWSSPVFARTEDLAIPDIPISLGVASKLSLFEIGLDYEPVTTDHIVVEWEKDENDFGEMVSGSMTKTYSYFLEFADNIDFISSIKVLVTEENKNEGGDGPFAILEKDLVQFNNLQANKPYYVKIKAIVEVADAESNRILRKESDYSDWVQIITETSKDEYTGEPDNVMDFDVDYEEFFNPYTNTWTYEIVNPDGVISQILNKNLPSFNVDLIFYDDFINPSTRQLIMPLSLVQTIANRGMDLVVDTFFVNYHINPRGIDTTYLRNTDKLELIFNHVNTYDLGSKNLAYPYIFQVAEQTNFNILSKYPINALSAPMDVNFRSGDQIPHNLTAQVYEPISDTWHMQDLSATVDSEGNAFQSFDTNLVGVNALYSKDFVEMSINMTHSMQEIANKYTIDELGTKYFGNTPVIGKQFSNLLLGIAFNNTNISIDKSLSTSETTQAYNSGLFTDNISDSVTNEAAVSGLIKLYEIKNGYPLWIDNSFLPYLDNSNSKYHSNLLKAYSMGIISPETFGPADIATFDYVCDLLVALGL
ncbi:MAG: hypothetical protein ATN31_00015 [Candidatus Epulonipiscioides saccharophilum]|nr:MAG: hypothetical protein ATN31_00015 [Epulopiscium sp. AS2M-Bin001]